MTMGSAYLMVKYISKTKNAIIAIFIIIVIVIFVYGGYLWMMSGGNPQRIALAKKTLISAAIGFVIILTSWAIVQFVFNSTNGTGGGRGGGGGGGGGVFVSSSDFRVLGYSPKGTVPVAVCMPVQVRFNAIVGQTTVVAAPNPSPTVHLRLTCTVGGDALCAAASLGTCSVSLNAQQYCGAEVRGTVTFAGPDVPNFTFRPTAELEKNATYLVTIDNGPSGVKSKSGTECAGTLVCKQWEFSTSGDTDKIPPQVTLVSPLDTATNVCRLKSIAAQFNEDMDEVTLRTPGAFSITPADTAFAPSVPSYTILRENPSSPMTANTLYAPLLNSDIITDACGNKLDGNENGTAEGSPTDNYPTSVVGTPPGTASTWSFTTGETTQCVPKIAGITPSPSYYDAPDSTLTITGENFDEIADTVLFARNLPVGTGTLACLNGTSTRTDQACFTDGLPTDQ